MKLQEAQQLLNENQNLIGSAESITGNKLTKLVLSPKPIHDHVKPIVESILNRQDYSSYLTQFEDFTVMMMFGEIKFSNFPSVDDLERYLKQANSI